MRNRIVYRSEVIVYRNEVIVYRSEVRPLSGFTAERVPRLGYIIAASARGDVSSDYAFSGGADMEFCELPKILRRLKTMKGGFFFLSLESTFEQLMQHEDASDVKGRLCW